ncbi:hypothetical protein F0562_033967 [Nyssa sinensis]|uniref:non-specific serine/threonine protein kinase n=1 Tax=Nyssa sinensis TaxID=561372 RepID=A0A5J5AG37_9ASTE|nr:hypothetical protein F0562_033967 [Nyssa sinensis]
MAATSPSPNSSPSAVPPASTTPPPQPPVASPPSPAGGSLALTPTTSPPPPPATVPPPSSNSPPLSSPPPSASVLPPSSNYPPPPPSSNPPASSPPPPSSKPPASSPPPPSSNPPANSTPPPSSDPPNNPPPPPASSEPPNNSPPPPPERSPPPPQNSPPTPSSKPPKNSPPPPASIPPKNSPPPPASSPPENSPPPPASIQPSSSPPPPVLTPPSVSPPVSPPSSNSPPKLSPPPPIIKLSPPPPSVLSPPSPSPPSPSQVPIPPSGNPTNNSNANVPENSNSNSTGNGGLGTGGTVAIGLVLGFVLLGIIGMAAWCMRKQKKKVSGLNGSYVMPTSLGSSPKSDSALLEMQTSAPRMGSGSGSDFVYSVGRARWIRQFKGCPLHFVGEGRPVMDWATRVKIAAGAARGIAYLHEDCHPRIIHRDIKSSNILLDINFEARVSDFGLAKLALDANSHITTRVMGTFGYMAPEYASSGKLTEKSDVFSFGVVLLELITGRKPVDASQPLGDESLVEWARPLLSHAIDTEEFEGLADPRLEKIYVDSEMFRMIEAAAACVRHSAAKRPRMGQVVRAFDSMATSDLTNGMRVAQPHIINQPKPFWTQKKTKAPFRLLLPPPPPPITMAKLEPDQLKQMKDIFKRFDMDSDGSLTHLELAALLRSLGLKPSGDQLHILLANMDSNGNGLIEFEELVDAILPDMNEEVLINQEQLLEVFQSFDRDGNGYITAAELAGQMAKMGHPLTYSELSHMIRDADSNGDGVISFNEFASIMGKSAADFLGLTVA